MRSDIQVTFPPELMARLREAAGPRGVARFVREAVEEKLARRVDRAI